MHPLRAQNLYDLAAGAQAAVFAAQAENDQDRRYGLLAAAERLTAELKRITSQLCEAAEFDEDQHHAMDGKRNEQAQ